MQTEFTCGIYTAVYNEMGGPKWFIKTTGHFVALVENDGLLIRYTSASPLLSVDDLLEISVLMNNIKRQYK